MTFLYGCSRTVCRSSRAAAILVLAAARISAQSVDRSPLPSPTGEHAVGRTQFDWIDESRADPDNPTRHREIVVWVWYPATVEPGAATAEWMPGKWGDVFASEYSKAHPATAAPSHLGSIRSHAYTDAATARSLRQYPVILFAPGLGTTPLDYSTIVEDIASHGYVVIGVVSPDFARASVFADGRVVPGHDPVQLAARGGARPSTALAIRAFEDAVRGVSKDLSFALNQLASVGKSPLKGSLDVTRVGVFGHSLGGAAALQCAHDDPRVRAVFDIDGSPIWSDQNGPLRKPVLVLSAASTNLNYDAVLDGAAPALHLRLAGTVHSFSSDIRVMPFSPQAASNARSAGESTPPARALRVTAAYLIAFFNQHLNDHREPLLNGPSAEYPEIAFERGVSR